MLKIEPCVSCDKICSEHLDALGYCKIIKEWYSKQYHGSYWTDV